jgi:hypothetical protein
MAQIAAETTPINHPFRIGRVKQTGMKIIAGEGLEPSAKA